MLLAVTAVVLCAAPAAARRRRRRSNARAKPTTTRSSSIQKNNNHTSGNYDGPEATRLATLKYAALSGAPYVDVELLAAPVFFAGAGEVPISTKVILSSHNFTETPSAEELAKRAAEMWAAGADIVKLAAMANDVADAATMLTLLRDQRGGRLFFFFGSWRARALFSTPAS